MVGRMDSNMDSIEFIRSLGNECCTWSTGIKVPCLCMPFPLPCRSPVSDRDKFHRGQRAYPRSRGSERGRLPRRVRARRNRSCHGCGGCSPATTWLATDGPRCCSGESGTIPRTERLDLWQNYRIECIRSSTNQR